MTGESSTEQAVTHNELSRYVDSLHKEYEIWYAKSVRRVFRMRVVLQTLTLLSGFLFFGVSALIAAGVLERANPLHNQHPYNLARALSLSCERPATISH